MSLMDGQTGKHEIHMCSFFTLERTYKNLKYITHFHEILALSIQEKKMCPQLLQTEK
jgi:hypothetical protein